MTDYAPAMHLTNMLKQCGRYHRCVVLRFQAWASLPVPFLKSETAGWACPPQQLVLGFKKPEPPYPSSRIALLFLVARHAELRLAHRMYNAVE